MSGNVTSFADVGEEARPRQIIEIGASAVFERPDMLNLQGVWASLFWNPALLAPPACAFDDLPPNSGRDSAHSCLSIASALAFSTPASRSNSPMTSNSAVSAGVILPIFKR